MRRLSALAVAACVLIAGAGAAGADAQLTSADAAALAQAMPRSDLSAQSIYFVMTDRYANGDFANDRGSTAGWGGLASGGFDATKDGYFHGGDLKGLTANLDRVKRLGFTAVWITPPFVNRAVQSSSAGYHGYWILDFTQIDPHLGTIADFDAFVAKAHTLGLKVYVDIVMNHTADVIQYDDFTSFAPPGSKKPFIPKGLEQAKAPAFLNDLANYHNQGNIGNWSDPDQYRNGDFFGLDDIKTENDAVVNGFADVYATWLVDHAVDGFRIDTAKHVDTDFFRRWVPALLKRAAEKAKARDALNAPQLFGEVYDANSSTLSSYMRTGGLPAVLDFGLQPAVDAFAAGTKSALAIDLVLADDDAFNTGDTPDARNAYGLPVFGGNHDMGRTAFMVQSEGGGSTPGQLLARTELAYSLLYLLRGAPVVYYGDEVGMVGAGGDKAARQDMMPTKVAAFASEERVGTKPIGTGSSLTAAAERLPMAVHLRTLNALRATYPALRNGALITRLAGRQTLAWSRIDAAERREFLVVANAADKTAKVRVQTASPATAFTGIFGAKASGKTDASGHLTVNVPARAVLVLRAAKPIPVPTAVPSFAVSASRNSDYKAVLLSTPEPKSLDPITITFVARNCATCEWKRLGSDDAPSFRLVLPEWAWNGGDYLDVAAITRASDMRVAAGPITHFTHADVA